MPVAYCPMCHRANRDTARNCRDCDYQFGQSIETVRGMLHVQLRRARIHFWSALALTGAAVALFVLAIVYRFVLIGVSVLPPLYWLVRSRQTISISKKSLASLDRQQPQLPKATLVER